MVRRTLSSVLVAAFVLVGFAAVVAAPAGAAKKPPKTTATTLLTDKQYSQSDCEAILAVGDKVQSASGTKFNPQQLADLAKGYEQTAGTVRDQDLKTNLLAIAKIYAAAAKSKSQVGALIALGKSGKAYGKALQVVVGATMSCAFSGITDLTLPKG
jgi:hypothetical protein